MTSEREGPNTFPTALGINKAVCTAMHADDLVLSLSPSLSLSSCLPPFFLVLSRFQVMAAASWENSSRTALVKEQVVSRRGLNPAITDE